MVPFHAVRCEVGKPRNVACRRITDGQSAAGFDLVITRVGAAPKIAVLRNACAIIRPATGIRAAFQSSDPQFQFFASGASNAKMEPLRKFRILIFADGKRRHMAINGVDDDIATVESGVDVSNRHFWFALARI